MAHKIPRCLEWVTSIHPLEPGDVLATGTNTGAQRLPGRRQDRAGNGRPRPPPLRRARRPQRTWARETRLDRQEKKQEGTTPQLTGKYAPTR